MKKTVLTFIISLFAVTINAQNLVYSESFQDSTNWELNTMDSVDGNIAISKIDSNQLYMSCTQDFYCPTAFASCYVKNDFLPEGVPYELKISIASSTPPEWSISSNVIQFSINNMQIAVPHSSLYYPDGCNLFIQSQDSITAYVISKNGKSKINSLVVDSTKQPDSLEFHIKISACGPDGYQSSELVIDSIALRTFPVINSIIQNKYVNCSVIKRDNRVILQFGENDFKQKNIEVFTIGGLLLKELKTNETEKTIDLSNYSPGIYLVRIQTETGSKTIKVIR